MQIDASRRWEAAITGVIALAVLFGGRYLLVSLSHAGVFAALLVGGIGAALLWGTWRRRTSGVPPLTLTRDTAFVACSVLTVAYIAAPARWSSGASIAAAEFGLALHALSLLAPSERPA